mgnify:CR=1 FL=1
MFINLYNIEIKNTKTTIFVVLYDLENDANQEFPLENVALECSLIESMAEIMRENGVQPEGFRRIGIPENGKITPIELVAQQKSYELDFKETMDMEYKWLGSARDEYLALINMFEPSQRDRIIGDFQNYIKGSNTVESKMLFRFAQENLPLEKQEMASYFLKLLARRK